MQAKVLIFDEKYAKMVAQKNLSSRVFKRVFPAVFAIGQYESIFYHKNQVEYQNLPNLEIFYR